MRIKQITRNLRQGDVVSVNGRRGAVMIAADLYLFPPNFWEIEYDDELGPTYPVHSSQITCINN